MAALSGLAETHEHIEDLFVTKEVNDAGIYMMQFYVNGLRQLVYVDDYLPVDKETK